MKIDPTRIITCKTTADPKRWLAREHAKSSEVWVRIFKKDSGELSVTWEDCVAQAIAWGWIDGIKKSYDGSSFVQRLTPRKPNSIWSEKNRAHAEKLIARKEMQPSGQRMVDTAKQNGRWDSAYSGQSAMEMPTDFLAALDGNAKAKAFFASLNRTNLFSIYHRLQTAKRPETRQARLEKIVAMLARHKKFHE